MNKENRQYILKDEPVTSALIHLSVPSILSNLVGTFHNMIDTYYVSQLKNNSMIAATTVALPISVLIYALGEGIGAGAESCIGRYMGAGKKDKVERAVSTTIALSCLLSITAALFSVTLLKPMISVFTDSIEVIEHAYQYMVIMTLGSVFVIFKQVFTHLLRSCGDVKFPMKTVFIEVAVNTILNPFFMFDFGLGLKIRGAAIATVIAQGLSTALLFYRLLHQNSELSWKVGDFRINVESMKEIVGVGSAVFIRNGLPSLSYGLFAKSAGLFGTDYVAASGLARKAEHMATFVVQGIAQGYQPFASYNFGAQNKERLMEAMKKAILFTTAYCCITAVLFFFGPKLIMMILTTDPLLIDYGSSILKWYALGLPIIGIYQILAASFQSMGKSKLSFITSVLRQGVIYCPMMVVLPVWLRETGFMMVQPLCDWISVCITCLLARSLIREIRQMNHLTMNE